jgi:hypothetical protein
MGADHDIAKTRCGNGATAQEPTSNPLRSTLENNAATVSVAPVSFCSNEDMEPIQCLLLENVQVILWMILSNSLEPDDVICQLEFM